MRDIIPRLEEGFQPWPQVVRIVLLQGASCDGPAQAIEVIQDADGDISPIADDQLKELLLLDEGHRMHGTNTPNHTDSLARTPDALGPNPDEQARIRSVLRAPSHLDGATVAHLTQGLYGQRRAEG